MRTFDKTAQLQAIVESCLASIVVGWVQDFGQIGASEKNVSNFCSQCVDTPIQVVIIGLITGELHRDIWGFG